LFNVNRWAVGHFTRFFTRAASRFDMDDHRDAAAGTANRQITTGMPG
jgi:hypothetical protein